jgi:hypothetical protein
MEQSSLRYILNTSEPNRSIWVRLSEEDFTKIKEVAQNKSLTLGQWVKSKVLEEFDGLRFKKFKKDNDNYENKSSLSELLKKNISTPVLPPSMGEGIAPDTPGGRCETDTTIANTISDEGPSVSM